MSKANEYAKAMEPFWVEEGVWRERMEAAGRRYNPLKFTALNGGFQAYVSTDGGLICQSGGMGGEEAIRFASWLLATFGEA
jgi:hypothetical protein